MVVVVLVVVVGVVLVVLLVGGLAHGARTRGRCEQRRTRDAEAFAHAQGWSYTRSSDAHGERYLGFPCGEGTARHGEHVMLGRYRGQQVTVAEQVFTPAQAEPGAAPERFLVASVAMAATRPSVQLEVRRRTRLGTGSLELADVSLGRPDLDRAFLVRTDDPAFAHAVLGVRTADWMLRDPRFAHVPLRFERADLLVWRPGPLKLHLVLPLLDLLLEIRDRVPTTPWR